MLVIRYSFHFFLSYSLFNLEILFDVLFLLSKSGAFIYIIILYSECPNVKYFLFSFFIKPLFIVPLPPLMLIVDLRIKSNRRTFTEAWSVRYQCANPHQRGIFRTLKQLFGDLKYCGMVRLL